MRFPAISKLLCKCTLPFPGSIRRKIYVQDKYYLYQDEV
jgi:hypothetical protein